MTATNTSATSSDRGSADLESKSRPIRVLCVTLYGDRAETATFVGLSKQGCEVTVCCMPDNPRIDELRAAGIRIVPCRFRGRFDPTAIRELREELGRRDYDVVHLFSNKPVSNGLRALSRFPKPKVVLYRGIVGNVSVWSPLSWFRYLSPRVDRIVCVAEAVRQYFLGLRLLGYRLPAERFVTIYKGHDLAWYANAPADLTRFDVPPGAFVVGCVTNWRPRKGVRVLIEAFNRLPEGLPIYLLLVGQMNSAALDRQIRKSPNVSHIRKLGFQKAAPEIIAACDVSVLPTLRREGLPKTVIEAMVAAVPPIVTDAGGSPELVVDHESGIVVPPGDPNALSAAILELYRDADLRARLGAAAQRRIETHFNIRDTVAQTLALYEEILGRKAPRSP